MAVQTVHTWLLHVHVHVRFNEGTANWPCKPALADYVLGNFYASMRARPIGRANGTQAPPSFMGRQALQ